MEAGLSVVGERGRGVTSDQQSFTHLRTLTLPKILQNVIKFSFDDDNHSPSIAMATMAVAITIHLSFFF